MSQINKQSLTIIKFIKETNDSLKKVMISQWFSSVLKIPKMFGLVLMMLMMLFFSLNGISDALD